MNSAKVRATDAASRALAARVTHLREQAGFSQKEFARAIGMHGPALGRIERGEVRLQAIDAAAMASALRITVDELLGAAPVKVEKHDGHRCWLYRSRLDRILDADNVFELEDMHRRGLEFGISIEKDAEAVTEEELGEAELQVRRKIAELGGLPRDW